MFASTAIAKNHGPWTDQEREAIAEARRLYPNLPQRELARRIFHEIGYTNGLGRNVLGRSEAAIYAVLRRHDAAATEPSTPDVPRFQEGQRVRVARNGLKYAHTPGFESIWIPDMNNAAGLSGVVVSQNRYGVKIHFGWHGDRKWLSRYTYPPQVLDLVDEKDPA